MTSKRELILLNMVSTLQTKCNMIKTVKRSLIKDVQELMQYAQPQLPIASVIGSLPVPEPHVSSSGGNGGLPMLFISTLNVGVYVYYSNNSEPDEFLSEISSQIWSAIYLDPTRGGNAKKTLVSPDPVVVKLGSTYYGFIFNVKVTYSHGIDSL